MAVVTSGLVAEYVGKWAKGTGMFGYTTSGASVDYGNDYTFLLTTFTLSDTATVRKLTAAMTEAAGYVGYAKGVIYAPNGTGGRPGTLVGATPERSISANADAWLDFVFTSALTLPPANYWMGLLVRRTGGSILGFRYTSGAGGYS